MTFKSWKKILKVFFLAVTRLVSEKKYILVIFWIICQKLDIIGDVIIPIATILKIFFYHFFFFLCNITKYDCAKLHVKSIFISKFMQDQGGGTMRPLPPPYRVWWDKHTLGQIGLIQNPKPIYGFTHHNKINNCVSDSCPFQSLDFRKVTETIIVLGLLSFTKSQHWILVTRISLGTKFQLKLIIFIFWTKIA